MKELDKLWILDLALKYPESPQKQDQTLLGYTTAVSSQAYARIYVRYELLGHVKRWAVLSATLSKKGKKKS